MPVDGRVGEQCVSMPRGAGAICTRTTPLQGGLPGVSLRRSSAHVWRCLQTRESRGGSLAASVRKGLVGEGLVGAGVHRFSSWVLAGVSS